MHLSLLPLLLNNSFQDKSTVNHVNEDEEEDEEDELGHTDTYAEYVPSKCKCYFMLLSELIFYLKYRRYTIEMSLN